MRVHLQRTTMEHRAGGASGTQRSPPCSWTRPRSAKPRSLRICLTSSIMSPAERASTVTEISTLVVSSFAERSFGNSLMPIRFRYQGSSTRHLSRCASRGGPAPSPCHHHFGALLDQLAHGGHLLCDPQIVEPSVAASPSMVHRVVLPLALFPATRLRRPGYLFSGRAYRAAWRGLPSVPGPRAASLRYSLRSAQRRRRQLRHQRQPAS